MSLQCHCKSYVVSLQWLLVSQETACRLRNMRAKCLKLFIPNFLPTALPLPLPSRTGILLLFRLAQIRKAFQLHCLQS